MKRFILALAAVFALGTAAFAEENVSDIIFLVNEDLFSNQDIIAQKANDISAAEKLAIYQMNEKKAGGPFALNFFLGYGIGSFVQKDYTAGGALLAGDLVGTGMMTGGLVLIVSEFSEVHDDDDGYNIMEDPRAVTGFALFGSGCLISFGFRIWGWVRPFSYAARYNETLKETLGLSESQSVSLAPVVDPYSNRYGLVAELKL